MKRTVLLSLAALLGAMLPAESRAQGACPEAAPARSIHKAWQAKSGRHPLAGTVLKVGKRRFARLAG